MPYKAVNVHPLCCAQLLRQLEKHRLGRGQTPGAAGGCHTGRSLRCQPPAPPVLPGWASGGRRHSQHHSGGKRHLPAQSRLRWRASAVPSWPGKGYGHRPFLPGLSVRLGTPSPGSGSCWSIPSPAAVSAVPEGLRDPCPWSLPSPATASETLEPDWNTSLIKEG